MSNDVVRIPGDIEDGTNWEATSVPSDLPGNWYKSGMLMVVMNFNSMIASNVTWTHLAVEQKDGVYRFIVQYGSTYRAQYYRNITSTTVERSSSGDVSSKSAARDSSPGTWETLSKSSGGSGGGVTLTAASASGSPGSAVRVSIFLDNSQVSVSGGQFVITASSSSYLTFNSASAGSRTLFPKLASLSKFFAADLCFSRHRSLPWQKHI